MGMITAVCDVMAVSGTQLLVGAQPTAHIILHDAHPPKKNGQSIGISELLSVYRHAKKGR
jgi:hypothetical protein